eukprot:g8840.t1
MSFLRGIVDPRDNPLEMSYYSPPYVAYPGLTSAPPASMFYPEGPAPAAGGARLYHEDAYSDTKVSTTSTSSATYERHTYREKPAADVPARGGAPPGLPPTSAAPGLSLTEGGSTTDYGPISFNTARAAAPVAVPVHVHHGQQFQLPPGASFQPPGSSSFQHQNYYSPGYNYGYNYPALHNSHAHPLSVPPHVLAALYQQGRLVVAGAGAGHHATPGPVHRNLPRRERFFVKRGGGTTEEEVITSQKFLGTFRVGIPHAHAFAAARRIIGPGGRNMKLIASMILGGKVRLRGEGFQGKDLQHPLQLNISCPTREGYVIAKALVSKLLKQLVQEFHETTLGKEAAVMRGSDHPMNPELPENWAHQFMQGYYNQMVDQTVFVTALPTSESEHETTSESQTASSDKGSSSNKTSASGGTSSAVFLEKIKMIDALRGTTARNQQGHAEVSTSADENTESTPATVLEGLSSAPGVVVAAAC